MIPTHEPIELIKAGELDVWGNTQPAETINLLGNLRSEIKTIRDNNGMEQVSAFTIVFRGVVNVKTEDSIRFIEPNGEVVEMNPIQVKFMRGFDGKPQYTKVVL